MTPRITKQQQIDKLTEDLAYWKKRYYEYEAKLKGDLKTELDNVFKLNLENDLLRSHRSRDQQAFLQWAKIEKTKEAVTIVYFRNDFERLQDVLFPQDKRGWIVNPTAE